MGLMKAFKSKWSKVAGALVLIGLGAFGLASGQFQAGFTAVLEGGKALLGIVDSVERVEPQPAPDKSEILLEDGGLST